MRYGTKKVRGVGGGGNVEFHLRMNTDMGIEVDGRWAEIGQATVF